jgi:hypothetical protein
VELLGTLGIYLILAFVLPGFVYLLAFGLCFPRAFSTIKRWLPPDDRQVQSSALFFFGAVLGLLLSSVTFAIEVALRSPFFFPAFFERWYPPIDFTQTHEAGSNANILIPSAIMHFNIGLGLAIFLLVYLVKGIYRTVSFRCVQNGQCRLFWALFFPRALLMLAMAILAVTNVVVSSALYRRVGALPAATTKTAPGNFPTSSIPGSSRPLIVLAQL